jgi:intein-encoded DNA endonuclease-like protein
MREPVEGPREGFQEVKGMAQGPGFCPEGEEFKKMEDNTTKTKRKKYLPRELRIKIYERVRALRSQGLSYSQIRDVIKREYGIVLSDSQMSEWVHGVHSPYNGIWIPSLELLKPSEDLAYVIGAMLGDGYPRKKSRNKKDHYIIRLGVKDKEFAEEFARRLAKVLGRPPIKVRYERSARRYIVEVESKTLYELLRPVNLKRLRKYIEHCKRCMAAFLRGFADSEGNVGVEGFIRIYNTNYELLKYVKKLLRKLGIECTGPKPHRKGDTTRKDCYYIRVRASSNATFYRYVGFTIKRKQKRLEEYLMVN